MCKCCVILLVEVSGTFYPNFQLFIPTQLDIRHREESVRWDSHGHAAGADHLAGGEQPLRRQRPRQRVGRTTHGGERSGRAARTG